MHTEGDRRASGALSTSPSPVPPATLPPAAAPTPPPTSLLKTELGGTRCLTTRPSYVPQNLSRTSGAENLDSVRCWRRALRRQSMLLQAPGCLPPWGAWGPHLRPLPPLGCASPQARAEGCGTCAAWSLQVSTDRSRQLCGKPDCLSPRH